MMRKFLMSMIVAGALGLLMGSTGCSSPDDKPTTGGKVTGETTKDAQLAPGGGSSTAQKAPMDPSK